MLRTSPCRSLPLLVLAGCHLFSSGKISETCNDLPSDCDGAFNTERLEIDSISPAFGHSTGGYTLVVQGSGFDEMTTAEIGGKDAEILSVTAGQLEVAAPASSPGVSDVALSRTDGQNARLEDGFEFFQDADGAVQFLAEFMSWQGIDVDGNEYSGTQGVGFWIEDDDARMWDRYGATTADFETVGFDGACNSGASDSPDAVSLTGNFADLHLEGQEHALSLIHQGDGIFGMEEPLDAADFPVDQALDLLTYEFAPGVSAGIEDAAIAPTSFQDARLSGTDWLQELPGDVVLKSTAPVDDADHKMVVLGYIQRGISGTVVATIACITNDDGYFRIDAAAWDLHGMSVWPEGEMMHLYIGRMRTQETVIPHTNGLASISTVNFQYLGGIVGAFED